MGAIPTFLTFKISKKSRGKSKEGVKFILTDYSYFWLSWKGVRLGK
jgi:hypothetical protein